MTTTHSPHSVWMSSPPQETTGWSWGCTARRCSAPWCHLCLRQSKSCPDRRHSPGASSLFPSETPCASGFLEGCSVPLKEGRRGKRTSMLFMIDHRVNACISVFEDRITAASQDCTCIQRRRPVRASYSIQEAPQHSHSHAQPPGTHGGHASPFVLLGIISTKTRWAFSVIIVQYVSFTKQFLCLNLPKKWSRDTTGFISVGITNKIWCERLM